MSENSRHLRAGFGNVSSEVKNGWTETRHKQPMAVLQKECWIRAALLLSHTAERGRF